MIEQYAVPLVIASVLLNALWLLGAWLVTRSSVCRWLWRALAPAVVVAQVAWAARVLLIDPMPTHTLRLGGFALNLDLGGLAWHVIIIPFALLAMLLQVVVLVRSKTSDTNS